MTKFTTLDDGECIDLTTALKVIRRLQLEDGDLGAVYWHSISRLLIEAEMYRERALSAESSLQKLKQLRSQADGGQAKS